MKQQLLPTHKRAHKCSLCSRRSVTRLWYRRRCTGVRSRRDGRTRRRTLLFSGCAAHTNTHLWFQVSTHRTLQSLSCLSHLEPAPPLDLTDEKTCHIVTHAHTQTLCDEYTAGAGDLTKLNFPLLPFPIFHLPQRRRTCVGENDAHRTNAMPHFLPSLCEPPLFIHSTDLCRRLLLCEQRFLFSAAFSSPRSPLSFIDCRRCSPPLPPSLCRFCGSAPLTKSQGETSAGVPAKFLCFSAQITWDSPNYHVANQSISWVSTGDACPPLLWLWGVPLDACFTATPRTCPSAASTPREAQLQRSNGSVEADG